jgi:hypothetical protein
MSRVKAGLAEDKCAFIALEKCDLTLDNFMRFLTPSSINFAVFKSIIFSILHALYVITHKYPKFRHYDLHTSNIMLKFDQDYEFSITKPRYRVFMLHGVRYTIPYFGITPKIIDFGFAVLPEEHIISNVIKNKDIMWYRSDNDIITLFHYIQLELGNRWGLVSDLLSDLEPHMIYVHFHPEYTSLNEHKIPTYKQMLDNKVWNEYLQIQPLPDQILNEYVL